MVDYEKGSPAWDIAQILTRHHTGHIPCARVLSLRGSIGKQPALRLQMALATGCTCGFGNSSSEKTSLRRIAPDDADGRDEG